MTNRLANITQLIHASMAFCNNTKSQLMCKDRMSPLPSLDVATGDQIVLPRPHALLHVNFTPLHYSGNIHWPFLAHAQHLPAL